MGNNDGKALIAVLAVVVIALFLIANKSDTGGSSGGTNAIYTLGNGVCETGEPVTGVDCGSLQGQSATCSLARSTTFQASGFDLLDGTLANINVEVRSSSGAVEAAETQANAALTTISTVMPNTFNGFVMIGNDNFESGTDRGTEYYYARYPLIYTCSGEPKGSQLNVYEEGTLTETGYDDGTSETLNVTVGTAIVDTTEIRIQTAANTAYGNPQLANPVGVCFNTTGSAHSDWDAIRPLNYKSTFEKPGYLSGQNIIGNCYVLPTTSDKALIDSPSETSDFKFRLRLDPAAGINPVDDAGLTAIFVDQTYCISDQQVWYACWGDNSDLAADGDIGSDDLTSNVLRVIIY